MLNEKVKEIIIIVTLSFIIAIIFNSCAKAVQLDDVYELALELDQSTITKTSNQRAAITEFINNYATIKSKLEAQGVINSLTDVVYMYNGSTYFIYYKTSGTGSVGGNESNRRYYYNNGGGTTYYLQKSNSYNNVITETSTGGYVNIKDSFGLLENNMFAFPSTTSDYKILMNNVYNYVNLLDRDNLTINTLPWYIADGRIGNFYINKNLHFYINNNGNKERLYEREVVSTPFILRLLNVQNVENFNNGGIYTITLEDPSGDIILTTTEFILEWSTGSTPSESGDNTSGTITNPSGDITGNIDLSGIQNTLGDINQNVEAIPEKIAEELYKSGESGEKGIFQKVYEDLFTISDDYVENKLQEIELDLGTSGDVELEKAFINLISGDTKGDFIIAWEQGRYNEFTIIPSGEINFSKLERDNEALQETMKWARVILGFSFGALLIKNWLFTICKTLGIGVSVYDQNKDESNIADKGDK